MLEFSLQEREVIARLSVSGGWDHPDAKPLKQRIKRHFSQKEPVVCCYCRLHLHRVHKITVDIEHVLPKSVYPQFTFEPRNLNLACKRCNMGIKLTKVSFYLGVPGEEDRFLASQYEFVHPNLDVPDDHLQVAVLQWNGNLLIKYVVMNQSSKGRAAYRFFDLRALEVNTFDQAQGAPAAALNSNLPPEIVAALAVIEAQIMPS